MFYQRWHRREAQREHRGDTEESQGDAGASQHIAESHGAHGAKPPKSWTSSRIHWFSNPRVHTSLSTILAVHSHHYRSIVPHDY